MRLVLLVLLVLTALATAAPAAAQTTPGLHCRGERPDRGCDAARSRRQRELYEMPSLEQLRDEGVQVRRIFFSQGIERSEWDIGALVFERRPGHGPTVRFQRPRGEDGRLPEPLVAELTPEAWREALDRSGNLDRRFVPLRDDQNVCMFGWDYTVEISDPAQGSAGDEEPATLRRRTENACYDPSPAEAYVLGMAALAERFFPACLVLRFPGDTEAVSRLPLCAALEGDRMAAAEVRNAIQPFINFHDPAEAALLFDAFAYDVEMDWNGERISRGRAAAERWARGVTESPGADFTITSFRGETGNRVRIVGTLEQFTRVEGREDRRLARFEMIWIRRGDGRFFIQQVTVGSFEPVATPPASRSRP